MADPSTWEARSPSKRAAQVEEESPFPPKSVPTLLDNSNAGGQLAHTAPTTEYPQRRLHTMGTRGQERGENDGSS
jgi:hypothetical protein